MTRLTDELDKLKFLKSLNSDQHKMLIDYLVEKSKIAHEKYPDSKFEETYFITFSWALMSVAIGYFPELKSGFMFGTIIVYDNIYEFGIWQAVHFKDQPPIKETLHLFN